MLCVAALTQALRGKVLTADSSGPVAGASVFISNTSLGAVAGSHGEFEMAKIPEGRFDLVVSAIGFETYVRSLQAAELPGNLLIYLRPKAKELEDVIVRSYEKDGWKKWGRVFVETLIGTSTYALRCKLKNKEAVKFVFNKKRDLLLAYASEALTLENPGLGYELSYRLVEFRYDFREGLFSFEGYPLFAEMQPKNKRQAKRWQQNRNDAYSGSLMHFMRAVYRNKISETGFGVKALKKIPGTEWQRIKPLYDSLTRMIAAGNTNYRPVNNDSLFYYKYVTDNPTSKEILFNTILPGDSIAYTMDSVTVGLFFNDYLNITFINKTEPPEYTDYYGAMRAGFISSGLFLADKEPIAVYANGSFFSGKNLITSGYWAWSEKLGNLLPHDFWPQ
jgi:hypothetical protein